MLNNLSPRGPWDHAGIPETEPTKMILILIRWQCENIILVVRMRVNQWLKIFHEPPAVLPAVHMAVV